MHECHIDRWLGIHGSKIIGSLKDLGIRHGNYRFATDEWSHFQKILRQTYGTRRSPKTGEKDITPEIAVAVYRHLSNKGEIRWAEFFRLCTLVGQRPIDYELLIKDNDYQIDKRHRIVRFTWEWGKSRTREDLIQHSDITFGKKKKSFYNIRQCLYRLGQLCPPGHHYLLDFGLDWSQKLRQTLNELPAAFQPDCKDQATVYYFKNTMTNVILRSRCGPEVACHYLKHVLSKEERANLAPRLKSQFGDTSLRYAIANDCYPEIDQKFSDFWAEVEARVAYLRPSQSC